MTSSRSRRSWSSADVVVSPPVALGVGDGLSQPRLGVIRVDSGALSDEAPQILSIVVVAVLDHALHQRRFIAVKRAVRQLGLSQKRLEDVDLDDAAGLLSIARMVRPGLTSPEILHRSGHHPAAPRHIGTHRTRSKWVDRHPRRRGGKLSPDRVTRDALYRDCSALHRSLLLSGAPSSPRTCRCPDRYKEHEHDRGRLSAKRASR